MKMGEKCGADMWGAIPGEVATDFFMVSFGGPIPPSGATPILV